jgi:hypothetical protein
MNKLHKKDFSIAFKTGSDANKSKFKKEAVQGEMYFATDSRYLYVAETTAGAIDATLARFEWLNLYNIPDSTDQQTEATIVTLTPTNPSGEVTVKFGSDTYDLYVWDGSAWYIYNNDYTP